MNSTQDLHIVRPFNIFIKQKGFGERYLKSNYTDTSYLQLSDSDCFYMLSFFSVDSSIQRWTHALTQVKGTAYDQL